MQPKVWSPPIGGLAAIKVLDDLKASKKIQHANAHHECIVDKPSRSGFTPPRSGARDRAQDPRATSKPHPWPPPFKRNFPASGTKDNATTTDEAPVNAAQKTAQTCHLTTSIPWDDDGRPTRPDAFWLRFAGDPEGAMWREFPRLSTLIPADVRRQAELLPVPDEAELDAMLLDGCKEFEWQRLARHHLRVMSWALRHAIHTVDYSDWWAQVVAYVDANRTSVGAPTGAVAPNTGV